MNVRLLFVSGFLSILTSAIAQPINNCKIADATTVDYSTKFAPYGLKVNQKKVNLSEDGSIVYQSATGLNASYILPTGIFHWGLLPNLSGIGLMFGTIDLLAPGYTETSWCNNSTGATSYSWKYYVQKEGNLQRVTSEDVDLVLPAYDIQSAIPVPNAPVLTASDGTNSENYTYSNYIKIGGGATNGLADYGAAAYNRLNIKSITTVDMFSSEGSDVLFERLRSAQVLQDGESVKTKGIGSFFDKPAAPYALSNVRVMGMISGNNGSEFTLTIYKATRNADGSIKIGDMLTESTAIYSTSMVDSDTGIANLPFLVTGPNLVGIDEALTIDSGIYCQLNYDNSNVSFNPVFPCMSTLDHSNAYVNILKTGGTQALIPASLFTFQSDQGEDLYCTDFMFHLGMSFNWLRSLDGNEFNTYSEGGEKTFSLRACDVCENWHCTLSDGSDLPKWLSVQATDSITTISNKTAYSGTSQLTIKVSQLIEGESERNADIVVSLPGASCTFKVSQSTGSGVSVATVSQFDVVCQDGNLCVLCADDNAIVEVYNMLGTQIYKGCDKVIPIPTTGIYVVRACGQTQKIAAK